jgi:hypothetical protein
MIIGASRAEDTARTGRIIAHMARTLVTAVWLIAFGAATAAAQTPQPFPRPGAAKPATPAAPPATTAQPARPPAVAPPTTAAPNPNDVPTEATLGVQIYPNAEFLQSFDAGKGQRYYLFGTNSTFVEIVNYYKTVLKQKGELIYDEPAIHEFDIGKFKEETMAFPPSVTVKDYTWGGSAGYLNPKRGKQPARFKTIIQIVPATPF